MVCQMLSRAISKLKVHWFPVCLFVNVDKRGRWQRSEGNGTRRLSARIGANFGRVSGDARRLHVFVSGGNELSSISSYQSPPVPLSSIQVSSTAFCIAPVLAAETILLTITVKMTRPLNMGKTSSLDGEYDPVRSCKCP